MILWRAAVWAPKLCLNFIKMHLALELIQFICLFPAVCLHKLGSTKKMRISKIWRVACIPLYYYNVVDLNWWFVNCPFRDRSNCLVGRIRPGGLRFPTSDVFDASAGLCEQDGSTSYLQCYCFGQLLSPHPRLKWSTTLWYFSLTTSEATGTFFSSKKERTSESYKKLQ